MSCPSSPVTKRAKITEYNRSSNESTSSMSLLLRYPFVIPILACVLDDYHVLCILLLVAKSFHRPLIGYQVKQPVRSDTYEHIVSSHRVRINKLKDVKKLPVDSSIIHLGMHRDYYETLTPNMLPPHLEYLLIRPIANQSIHTGIFPNSLREPHFAGYTEFDRPLSVGSLPSSLTVLDLGEYYDQPIAQDVVPSSVRSLRVGRLHGDPRVLPASLTDLKVESFVDKLYPGSLPPSIKHLEVSFKLQPIDAGVLHAVLTKLCFNYSHSWVTGMLSETLLELSVTRGQNIPIGVLPRSLKRLELSDVYIEPGAFPGGLQDLSVSLMYQQPNVWEQCSYGKPFIPTWLRHTHLTSLHIHVYPSHLVPGIFPSSLETLDLELRADMCDEIDASKLEYHHACTPCRWTANTFELTLLPGTVPQSVATFKLRWEYVDNYCVVSGSLPTSLSSLSLRNCVPSPTLLNNQITHLTVGDSFWNQIIDILARVPTSLTHLTLTNCFFPEAEDDNDYPLPHIDWEYADMQGFRVQYVIPPSVTHLYIAHWYNEYAQFFTLPPNLVELHVGEDFPSILLPSGVRKCVDQGPHTGIIPSWYGNPAYG